MARKPGKKQEEDWSLFDAEGAYAESIFQNALGDTEGSIAALERSLEFKPDYAPALLTMGTVQYQLDNPEEGARLFSELLLAPDDAGDLWEIFDKAGDFLIQEKLYAEGLELYQAAVKRFPEHSVLYQGLGCCAGHEGLFDQAIEASRMALQLDPDRQTLTSDLGWTLFLAGRLDEAEEVLQKAVAMDSSDKLARENLRICKEARQKQKQPPKRTTKKRKGESADLGELPEKP
jgi:tetratricopeptide (TPR) repeat protein